MDEIRLSTEKTMVIASGRAHPELAEEIARELGTELLPMSAYDFANGELYVRSSESVRGKDVFLLQSHPAPLNNWLMEQLIMIDSMKRASAKRITVVSPFYPYSRQDKKGRGREPISARLVADLYKAAGADRIMSVDLHTAQIQASSTGRWITSSPCRCWPTTSGPRSPTMRSPWSPRTPAVSGWPSSGPSGWAAPRWPSCTRPVM